MNLEVSTQTGAKVLDNARAQGMSIDDYLQQLMAESAEQQVRPRLEISNGLPVFVSPPGARTITAEEVNELIQQVRDERARL